MAKQKPWTFDPSALDLDGDMTLVVARRRGTRLEGYKVEFAKQATTELRSTIQRTVERLASLTARPYEPSLVIVPGVEYLAVPDRLVQRAATPLTASTKSSNAGKGVNPDSHIETDPQVRALLGRASGLAPLGAQDLEGPPFQFYAVVVGNDPATRTSFVRKTNPVKALGAGKLWFSFGNRLTTVTEPLFVLDDHFDLVATADGIAVLNQSVFDSLFRDAETLVNRYPIWAKAFATLGLDSAQTDQLVVRCRQDSRLASRLRQIHESGHLAAGKVKLGSVLTEADRVAGGRTQFLKDGKLDFGCQGVSTLLKLLNDDLFIGGLSKVSYEAGSKARQQ